MNYLSLQPHTMTLRRDDKEILEDLSNTRDQLPIPKALIQEKNLSILKIKGDYLLDEGIRDGDLIVVQPRSTGEIGATVLASVGGKPSVKIFQLDDAKNIRLQSNNEKIKPIVAREDEVEIRGLVVSIIRKY